MEIIKGLLHKGMFVDFSKAVDLTPLHILGVYGNLEATKAFVQRAAGLDNANKHGFTTMPLAAWNGEIEVFRYLKEIRTDNMCDVQSNTAFHYGAFSGSVKIIKILLEKGMSVDLRSGDDSTPLHVSAKCGNLEATKSLVERGVPFDNADRDGDTPLLLAARHRKIRSFL